MSAVMGAHQAASRAMLDDDIAPFSEYVAAGVSADLCKALASMTTHGASAAQIEISVTWSHVWRPPVRETRPISFSRDVLDVINEGATFLSESTPREDFELVGFVTHLHRGHDERQGEVTVAGTIDQKWRNIRIRLGENDYAIALKAHEQRSALRITGELRKEGNQYRLDRPCVDREPPID